MAKKSSSTKKKSTPPSAPKEPVAVEIEEPTPATATERATKAPKLTRSQLAAERIEDEYAYITDDLRRVFILAGAMFALLVVLNIVLGLMN